MKVEMAEGGGSTNINGEEDQGYDDDIPIHDVTPTLDIRELRWIGEDGNYKVAGGLHGFEYQKKFLMFFAIRAYNNHEHFLLATEVEMAPKFNDIVLAFPNDNGTGFRHLMVQMKHTITNYGIKASSLLSTSKTKNDYSLPMYFGNYFKFRENFLGKKDEIDQLIICGNGGFLYGTECDGFFLDEAIFEGFELDDPVFGRKLVRFKKNFPGRDKLVSSLLELYGNSSKNNKKVSVENKVQLTAEEKSEDENLWRSLMTKKLTEYILKNASNGIVEIRDKDNKIYRNINKLKSINVLEGENGCFWFSRKFLECVEITEDAKDLRSQLLESLNAYEVDEIVLKGIRFVLDQKLIQFEAPRESDVDHFLSILVFAFDQPDTKKLEGIIKKHLQAILGKGDVRMEYRIFDSIIGEWMNSFEGNPLTNEDLEDIFQRLRDIIILRPGDFKMESPGRCN